MLRVHFLQHWFELSDPGAGEALYDSCAMRLVRFQQGSALRSGKECAVCVYEVRPCEPSAGQEAIVGHLTGQSRLKALNLPKTRLIQMRM